MSNVSVQVMTDKIVEGTEEFMLLLNVPSFLGPAITAGSRNTAVGFINDSTSKNFCTYTSILTIVTQKPNVVYSHMAAVVVMQQYILNRQKHGIPLYASPQHTSLTTV